MIYLIITLVLLVALAPIFAILPSARQKAQMKMRDAARQAGISVKITVIDDPNPRQEKYLSQTTGRMMPARLKLACYRLQLPTPVMDIHWRYERKPAAAGQATGAGVKGQGHNAAGQAVNSGGAGVKGRGYNAAGQATGAGVKGQGHNAAGLATESGKAVTVSGQLNDNEAVLMLVEASNLPPGLASFLDREVPRLPTDVEAIEATPAGLGIYWHEGMPGTEQQVIRFLKDCAALHLPLDQGQSRL